jgi:hypothetical protein
MEAPMTPITLDYPAVDAAPAPGGVVTSPAALTGTGYWGYAAYPNQWATVHRAGCSHCRAGRGQEGAPAKRTTTDWFGPFTSREAAFARAARTGLETVSGCGHCRP